MSLREMKFPVKYHPSWEIIDSTKLQTYMDCPRQFFYNYVLGWESEKPSNHLHFGAAVHHAKEHLLLNGYSATSMSQAYMKFHKYYRQKFPEETDELYSPKTPARYLDMLLEYIQEYASDEQQYKVLYTEIAGRISLDGYHTIAFRMDSILEDNRDQGKKLSLEHKTKGGDFSGYYGESWKMEWELSAQIGTYLHVLYSLYPPGEIQGVKINGLGFKKTKSHLFALGRFLYYKDIEQMQIWQQMMIDWMDKLEADFEWLSKKDNMDNQIMQSFPLNPRSCTKYLGCQYHNYCVAWGNPIARSQQPPIGFVERFWNPLEEESKWMFDLEDGKVKEIKEVIIEKTEKKGFSAIET